MKIKPCPFCGGESVYYSGWKFGDRKKDPENNRKGRSPSICCEECGIGFETGYIGAGISDRQAKKQTIESWNRRVNDR